jgi:hypothetical protein
MEGPLPVPRGGPVNYQTARRPAGSAAQKKDPRHALRSEAGQARRDRISRGHLIMRPIRGELSKKTVRHDSLTPAGLHGDDCGARRGYLRTLTGAVTPLLALGDQLAMRKVARTSGSPGSLL